MTATILEPVQEAAPQKAQEPEMSLASASLNNSSQFEVVEIATLPESEFATACECNLRSDK